MCSFETYCVVNCITDFVYVCVAKREVEHIYFTSAYLWNHICKLHRNFCTCYLWPWFNSSLAALQYVMHFRFGGWRHIFHNGPCGTSDTSRLYLNITHQGAGRISHCITYSNWLTRRQHHTRKKSEVYKYLVFISHHIIWQCAVQKSDVNMFDC